MSPKPRPRPEASLGSREHSRRGNAPADKNPEDAAAEVNGTGGGEDAASGRSVPRSTRMATVPLGMFRLIFSNSEEVNLAPQAGVLPGSRVKFGAETIPIRLH